MDTLLIERLANSIRVVARRSGFALAVASITALVHLLYSGSTVTQFSFSIFALAYLALVGIQSFYERTTLSLRLKLLSIDRIARDARLSRSDARRIKNSILLEHFEDASTERITRRQIDLRATSEDEQQKDQAIKYYRQKLKSGDNSPDIAHNLAVLLRNVSGDQETVYSAEIMNLWRNAYAKSPSNLKIRVGFASFLIAQKKTSLASKVLDGKPLNLIAEGIFNE